MVGVNGMVIEIGVDTATATAAATAAATATAAAATATATAAAAVAVVVVVGVDDIGSGFTKKNQPCISFTSDWVSDIHFRGSTI